jgi:hypothetical protein
MVITRAEATSAGTTDDELRRLVASGAYVRLLRGVYAEVAELGTSDEERHRLRVVAMARRSGYAASHVSAAVLHRLPVSGADLSQNVSAVDAVLSEKRRESRLVELGWIVIRIDASDLRDPARLRARVRAALDRAQRTGTRPAGRYELTPRVG